jgi:hypothetical protein
MRKFLSLAALLSVTACGPTWVVVKQANPDPFVGAKKFSAAVDFTNMKYGGKDEATFTAKGPEEKAGWDKSKEAFQTNFLDTFKAKAKDGGYEVVDADAPFAIKVLVGDMSPGYYAVMSQNPSTTPITLQVTAPDGNVLDEVTMVSRTNGDTFHPSPDSRVREDAITLGKMAVKYLDSRTAAPK